MKTNYLLSSLCLAPLALTAPLSHSVTLVAGKTVFKPGHQIATLFEEVQHVLVSKPSKSQHKLEESSSPSTILDADRPLTTAELMELSTKAAAAAQVPQPMTVSSPPSHPKSHKPKKHTKDANRKISVGALVVPTPSRVGVMAKVFDPQQASPYLIPGQYVASQRADVLIVGLILACVLIVVAMESWELICNFVSTRGLFRRQGSIRLADSNNADVESGENDEEDSDDEDDCDAPFGGFAKRTREKKGLRLPEQVDEKAAWI